MAILRDKYYSSASKSFIDVPTTFGNSFVSSDIGSSGSNVDDVIRLIPYGNSLSTSTLADLIGDLLHNDNILNSEINKTSSFVSDGITRGALQDFNIIKVKIPTVSSGSGYLASFGILGGQIKYRENLISFDTPKIIKTVISSSGDTVVLNDVTNLHVGDIVVSKAFSFGTQISAIDTVTKTVTLDSSIIGTLINSNPIVFGRAAIFGISVAGVPTPGTSPNGLLFDTMTSTSSLPVYRRDLIEFNIYNSTFNIVKGTEKSFLNPIHTQLDSQYQIVAFNHISGFEHEITLKPSIRDSLILNDFSVGGILKIRDTDDKLFDGDWVITSLDGPNKKIKFIVNHVNNGSYYQNPSYSKTLGSVDIGRIALYSIPLIKHNSLITSTGLADLLILDRIESVLGFSGLSSSLTQITRSLLSKDVDSFYGIKNRDYVHVCDNIGRPLDWEYGQSYDQEPVVGYTSFNDSVTSESITSTQWIESSLPQTYNSVDVSLAANNFSNAPFFINSISDDVFSTDKVFIERVAIAIQNDPVSIGAEDIKYKMVKANKVTGYSDPRSCSLSTSFFNRINEFDTSLLSSVMVGNFILITGGKGRGQVAKVLGKDPTGFTIDTLPISLDATSTYMAFSSFSDVASSEGTLLNSEVNSQVITGINGTFGLDGEYRKVLLPFSNIQIDLKQFYFLSLSQTNTVITNPAWSTPPKILISSFNSNDTYWSPFLEVYYKTVQGFYGTGIENYLLIEDDLGDISKENSFRELEPHFRPTKYQLMARGLDDSLMSSQEPMSEEIVFIDVHTGRLKFKKGSEPRNLFVSYYRKESFSGDASDFSVIYKTTSDDRNRTVQDKFAELDSHLTNGISFNSPVTFNGINSSVSSDGFKGPFFVNPFDSFHIKYSLPNIFNNHKINHKDFMIKFSNHYFDELVKITKDSVYILNDTFLVEDIISEDTFTNSPSINFQDYVDTRDESVTSFFPSISGTINNDKIDLNTLSVPGLNVYDEVVIPGGPAVSFSTSFLKKKWNGGFKDEYSFSPDSAFYDTENRASVNGAWNEEYSFPFGEFQFLRSLLRKNYYESLPIPGGNDSKYRIKQRESVGVFANQLEATGIKRSVGKIVSESYCNTSKTLTHKELQEAFVYATADNTKGELETFNGTDSDLLVGFTSTTENTYHSFIEGGVFYLAYLSLTGGSSNDIYIKKRNIEKAISEIEWNEYTSLSGNSTSNLLIEKLSNLYRPNIGVNSGIIKIKTIDFDKLSLGLLYAYSDGTIVFELRNKSDLSLVTGSQKVVNKDTTSTLNVTSRLIDCYTIDDNGVAIAWCSSSSKTLLNIYRYEYTSGSSSLINEITLSSSTSISVSPKISLFYKDNDFVVGYFESGGLKIKRFSRFGIPQAIVSNTSGVSVSSSIDYFDMKELNDNSLLFAFRKTISATDNYVLKKLSSFDETFSDEISFLTDASSNDVHISLLNEDSFVVSTKDFGGSVVQKTFFNNMIEVSSSIKLLAPTTFKVNKMSDHGLFYTYINANDIKYYTSEIKPDINLKYRSNLPTSIIATATGIESLSLNDNEEALVYTTSTSININLFDRWSESSYNQSLVSFTNTKVVSNFHSLFISGTTNLLIVGYISGGGLEFNFYKKTTTAGGWTFLVNIPSGTTGISGGNLNGKTLQSVRLHYLGSNKVLVVSGDSTNIYFNVFSIDDFLTSSTPSFISSNSTFSLATTSNTPCSSSEIKIITFQESDGYSNTVGVFHENTILKCLVFESTSLMLSSWASNVRTTLLSTSGITKRSGEFSITPILEKKIKKFAIGYIDTSNKLQISECIFIPSVSTPSITYTSLTFIQPTVSLLKNSIHISYHSDKKSFCVLYFDTIGDLILGNVIQDQTTTLYSYSNAGVLPKENDQKVFKVNTLRDSISVVDYEPSAVNIRNIVSYPLSFPMNESRVYKSGTKYYTKMYSGIKIGGVDFRGNVNSKIAIDTYSENVDLTFVNGEGIFISKNSSTANVSLLSYSSGNFSIVLHDSGDSLSKNFIRIRHFTFQRNRVFAVSPWINIQIDDLNQIGVPYSSSIKLGLRAVEKEGDILLSYSFANEIKFVKLQILNDGSIAPYSYTGLVGVKSYGEVGKVFYPLSMRNVLDGNTALLIEADDLSYRTLLLDKNEDTLFSPLSFNISSFSRQKDIVSEPQITPFGYFYHYYIKTDLVGINIVKKLMLLQHGWNGTKFGSVQLIGKNYIEAIKTTPDSFIEKIVTQTAVSSGNTQRAQYTLADDSSKIINISNFFPSLDILGGMYDVWVESNPLISCRFFLKKTPITVTFISNSALFVNKSVTGGNPISSSEDLKLTIFQDGTDLFIVNRLGQSEKIIFIRNT